MFRNVLHRYNPRILDDRNLIYIYIDGFLYLPTKQQDEITDYIGSICNTQVLWCEHEAGDPYCFTIGEVLDI